jgi:hypothetical protein
VYVDVLTARLYDKIGTPLPWPDAQMPHGVEL